MAQANVFPALPLEVRQKHKEHVQAEIKKRWQKVLEKKSSFASYKKKSDQEILKEFQELHLLRQHLWYRNPEQSPHICQEDYMAAQELLEKGYYKLAHNIAFSYNCTDNSYNASTVLIEGYHFIAMQEPSENTLNLFFKFLINHQVSILVRVKPEYEPSSVRYWVGRLQRNLKGTFLNIMPIGEDEDFPGPIYMPLKEGGNSSESIYISYFYTDEWIDNEAVDIGELYRLVQEVRRTYATSDKEKPIACHCASGVGRTGAYIAAFVLAEMIDQSKGKVPSIEEIVLKLSIQRPNLMGTAKQYLLLYRFVDYYLDKIHRKIG